MSSTLGDVKLEDLKYIVFRVGRRRRVGRWAILSARKPRFYL